MAANNSIVQNPSILSPDELLDEYEKLSKLYLELKQYFDKSEQQIYDLNRNLQLCDAGKASLQDELDTIAEAHENELKMVKERHQMEANNLRFRLTDAKELNGQLECEIERLKSEAAANIVAAVKQCEADAVVHKKRESQDNRQQYLENIEVENLNLVRDYDELKEKLVVALEKIANNEANLENLREQYSCAEDNLNTKRNELEEKTQVIDSMQEKIVEMSAELATYKSNTDTNKKGNSLFAEVDDQRQRMKDILAAQKQAYMKMKKEHQLAQVEIKRLKRENADLRTEPEMCKKMFMTAAKYQKETLYERIGELNNDNEQLRKKLAWTESKLIELAEEHKITWLDSMLEYCKNETDKLKKDLYSCRLHKLQAEEGFVKATEQASQWRFEALKLRCVIIDREMLLEENKIPFEPVKDIGCKVREKFNDGSNEVPHLGVENIASSTNTIPDTSIIGCQDEKLNSGIKIEKIESLASVPDISTLSVKEEDTTPSISSVYKPEISLTAKTEPTLLIDTSNKENIAENGTIFSNQLSPTKHLESDVSSISTIVQPQFRDIQMSAQRKNVLKGVTEEIINKTPKVDKVNTNRRQLKYPTASSMQCEFLGELNALKDHSNEQSVTSKVDGVKCVGAEQFSGKSERPDLVLNTNATERKPIKPKVTIKHIILTRKK